MLEGTALFISRIFSRRLQRLLQSEHLVAYVIADLNRDRIFEFEFFATTVLKNGLALLIRALVLATPLFMLVNEREQDEFAAGLARNFEDVDELLEDVRARSHAQDAWALEWTVFLPLLDASLAEELAAVVALHGLPQYQQTDAADERVFELLVHDAVLDLVQVVTARVVRGAV